MEFSHRKMLDHSLQRKDFTILFFIPCFQNYPPTSPPPPPPLANYDHFANGSKQQRDLSILVSTLIAVIGSTLLFISIIVFLFLYFKKSRRNSTAVAPLNIDRRQNGDEAEETNITGTHIDHHVWRIATVGLQRSAIDSITVIEFKKAEEIIDSTQCSVCLNEFQDDDSLRLLPKCSHAFHVNCIDTWLLSHKNCPLCRAPVLLKEKTITKSTHDQTPTMIDSVSSNELSTEEESSRNRKLSSISRAQSNSAKKCGTHTVKRSFSSIAGSSSQIDTKTAKNPFLSSFSAKFSSSLRRSINQDQFFTNRSSEDSD